MGNFRKIHTIPQRAFQDCKDRGAVGRGHLRTGNLKAWGKLMSGILVFLVNAFFMDLKNKA